MPAGQTDRDLALTAELHQRLKNLSRALDAKYGPALRRLRAAKVPGASAAYATLMGPEAGGIDDGFLVALRWLLRDVEGVTFAAGDPDLMTYWELGLGGGQFIDGERDPDDVMTELVAIDPHPAARYASYLQGQERALRELVDVSTEDA